jgi:hypothetical protein
MQLDTAQEADLMLKTGESEAYQLAEVPFGILNSTDSAG